MVNASIEKPTAPASGLKSVRAWRKEIGVSPTTCWRWQQLKLIRPVNIAGRLYLRAADLLRFERLAAKGKLARPLTGGAANKHAARLTKEGKEGA